MAEYARVVSFDAAGAAIDALLGEINGADGPPPGVPATRITVLTNRAAGKVSVSIRFGSEDDLRSSAKALDAMSPLSGGTIRRVSVEEYEVTLDRQT